MGRVAALKPAPPKNLATRPGFQARHVQGHRRRILYTAAVQGDLSETCSTLTMSRQSMIKHMNKQSHPFPDAARAHANDLRPPSTCR